MKSRDENGHKEKGTSRKFLCKTIQVGCTLEELYFSREGGTRQNREAIWDKGVFCGT